MLESGVLGSRTATVEKEVEVSYIYIGHLTVLGVDKSVIHRHTFNRLITWSLFILARIDIS